MSVLIPSKREVLTGSENSEELENKQQPRFAQDCHTSITASPTSQETPQLLEIRIVGHPRILGIQIFQGNLPRYSHPKCQDLLFPQ